MESSLLPKRLETERPYGQFGYVQKRKDKNSSNLTNNDEFISDFHIPDKSIYGQLSAQEINSPTSLNVISVIGVLPSQKYILSNYFSQIGYHPKIEMSNRGNWAYLEFDKNIEDIEEITPTMQIDEHIMVGCYIGKFQQEELLQIPSRAAKVEPELERLLKLPKQTDLTSIPLEEKSYFTLFQEMILGKDTVSNQNGTFLSSLYNSLSKLKFW